VSNTNGQQFTDKNLVERVLHGDEQAFVTIVRNTEGLLARIVCSLIENREERKDIVQDIYSKVFSKLSGFNFESKLSTWIAQIAYNHCISWLRKKKLVFPGDLDGLEEQSEQRYGAITDSSVHDQLINKDLSGILRKQMNKLPAVYQLLLSLFHQEEMSYPEIIRITGLPEGTVKSYLFRARKSLKQHLLSHYKREAL
jgi:RNA polymerase sigma factor (sigma-70 family)